MRVSLCLIHVIPSRRHRPTTACATDTSLQPSTRSPSSSIASSPSASSAAPRPISSLATLKFPLASSRPYCRASRGLPTFLFELTPQKRAPQYLSPCVTHVELELDASPLAPRSGPHVLLDTLLFIVAFDLLSYGTFPFLSFVLDRPPLLFAPLSSS